MCRTALVFIALIASTCAVPLLGGLTGGSSSGGGLLGGLTGGSGSSSSGSSSGSSSSGSSSGGLLGNLLPSVLDGSLLGKLLPVLPLNGGLDGVVGDLITLVRLLLTKVLVILNQLLPSLDTQALSDLTGLLSNPNMTKSEILETIDGFISGQPIKLQTLYKAIVADVEGKVSAILDTLTKVATDISPALGQLVGQIASVVNNDALTLLDENSALGKLLSQLLQDVDILLADLLKNVQTLLNQILNGNLIDLNSVLSVAGILNLSGILGGLLGTGSTGLLGVVENLLNTLLGGGLLGGVLGGGLLGGLLG